MTSVAGYGPPPREVSDFRGPHEVSDLAGTPGLPPHQISDFAGTPGLPPHQISDLAGTPGLRFSDRGLPPLHYFGRIIGQPPIWLEGRVLSENLRLRGTAIYAGDGLPRGTGQPVLLIPGFMAGARSLATLQGWLLRIGYHAEITGVGFNVRHSEAILNMVLLRLVDLYGWLGQRVTLIGHSRGGLLAKVAAHRHPEMVECVAALGAPLADPYDISPFTMAGVRMAQAFNLVRFGRTGAVERPFLQDLAAPARRPLVSVYSRTDAIVHWRACIRPDARCVEVVSSHVGLAVNPDVYAVLAHLLASPGRPWRRPSATYV